MGVRQQGCMVKTEAEPCEGPSRKSETAEKVKNKIYLNGLVVCHGTRAEEMGDVAAT
jgi:hypothetical protein